MPVCFKLEDMMKYFKMLIYVNDMSYSYKIHYRMDSKWPYRLTEDDRMFIRLGSDQPTCLPKKTEKGMSIYLCLVRNIPICQTSTYINVS